MEERRMTFVVRGTAEEFLAAVEEFVKHIRNDNLDWMYCGDFDYRETGRFEMRYITESVGDDKGKRKDSEP